MLLGSDSEMESRLFQEVRKQHRKMLDCPSSLYVSSSVVTVVENKTCNECALL